MQKSWENFQEFCRKRREGLRKKGMQKQPRLTYFILYTVYCILSFSISPMQEWHQRGRIVPWLHCWEKLNLKPSTPGTRVLQGGTSIGCDSSGVTIPR